MVEITLFKTGLNLSTKYTDYHLEIQVGHLQNAYNHLIDDTGKISSST